MPRGGADRGARHNRVRGGGAPTAVLVGSGETFQLLSFRMMRYMHTYIHMFFQCEEEWRSCQQRVGPESRTPGHDHRAISCGC